MTKFSIDRFPAGFFDVTQDIAGELPVELIEHWTHGDRSRASALRLLSAHAVTGSVVSTDAAGLTSLTRARSVIEILALLNQPKEIVHACGAAIGGEAVGVWAADNTQMLYQRAEPGRLLSALLETRDRIARACEIQIGMCVHHGSFFRLGGGLYGTEIKTIGNLGIYTFDHAGGGLDFARRFRAMFAEQQVAVRIGIDQGEVLVFDLGKGREDIAGVPVNLASKIAQDHGQFGRIYLTDAAAVSADASALERLVFRIAGVDVGVRAD
jgi:class 3 adenylate cyclase